MPGTRVDSVTECLRNTKPNCADLLDNPNMVPSVPEWFRDRGVLVTGATGFMGKVLIAKLLSSCPEGGRIFLLVREKRGVEPKARLHSLIQQEPFRALREDHPESLRKLVVVSGDTTVEGFGLSSSDKEQLIENVSVIFHMAANVRFDLPLKTAINMNTRGTANLLSLAKELPHLKSLVHVSTAYCQCGQEVLEEKAYSPSVSPEKLLSTIDMLDDNVLESVTPQVLGDQPNTYAFSKSLSEDLVARCELPAGIVRPSIVVASWKEPAEGWVENMNGPTGLMIGAGKGVIRSMLCNKDYLADLIPCDLACNATIALAWRVGIEQPKEPIFMNVTDSGENPISWGEALETGKRHALANPFSGPLWYPGGRITSSKTLHWLSVIFLHLLPAYLLDILFLLTGNKPFLIRVQAKISSGLELLQYYTTKQWIFRNDVMKDLQERLNPTDRKTFFMDTKAFTWDDYFLAYILGTRRYCLKEDPSTLPQSRRVFAYLYIADIALRIAVGSIILWTIYKWIMPTQMITTTLVEINDP